MLTKLFYGAVRNNVLERPDFELLVAQTTHLINKRPVAFQDSLRETNSKNEMPEVITLELLLKGTNLVSMNVIPALDDIDDDPEWISPSDKYLTIRQEFTKLRKTRNNLSEMYNNEFLQNLIKQSTDKNDRYKPIKHEILKKGDIVIIKEPQMKVFNFPLALVHKVLTNNIGEVTDAILYKGKTGEQVQRHVTTLIPLLRPESVVEIPSVPESVHTVRKQPERTAKILGRKKATNLNN